MARQAFKDAETGARAMVPSTTKWMLKWQTQSHCLNTQQYKDYKKGNQQRKIKAMKQGMPMVDKMVQVLVQMQYKVVH